ncbi:MAG: hypothetical protein CMM59_12665 [Rhodospirillaceae bacterium]|nr:hypothetical protein [Rhodospirillaceae bacterium]
MSFFATGDNSAQHLGIENLIRRHHRAGEELFIRNILRGGRLSKHRCGEKEQMGAASILNLLRRIRNSFNLP